jgi:hypothetical protein
MQKRKKMEVGALRICFSLITDRLAKRLNRVVLRGGSSQASSFPDAPLRIGN